MARAVARHAGSTRNPSAAAPLSRVRGVTRPTTPPGLPGGDGRDEDERPSRGHDKPVNGTATYLVEIGYMTRSSSVHLLLRFNLNARRKMDPGPAACRPTGVTYFSAATVVNSVRHATVLCGAEPGKILQWTSHQEKGWKWCVVSKYTWSPRRRKIQHDRGAVWASSGPTTRARS